MSTPIADRVAAVIDELFGLPADALSPETALQDGLHLDSLSVVELQVAIEDAFGVRFVQDEAEAVQTVGDLVAAVEGALHRQRRAS